MFIPRTISNAVDRIARQTVGKDWALYAALLDHWPEIVGAHYARLTTPVKIAFPPKQTEARKQNGVLTVLLPKGLAMEFSFKTEQIRLRIADYLGYEAITKIAFEHSFGAAPDHAPPPAETDPAALKAVHEAAKDIGDEDLRAALEAFGESIAKAPKSAN